MGNLTSVDWGVAILCVLCVQSARPIRALGEEEPCVADAASAEPTKISSEHLRNLVRVHPRVLSGGLPQGDAAFGELQRLEVKTIISVDGMKPDVNQARQFGMRYVHLPHGYDGISETRVKELAKAVREFSGRIYIHCHRGKHRSAAAASVACVATGLISPQQAEAVLNLAGTSPNYKGLYEAVRQAKLEDVALLDQLPVNFKTAEETPPIVEAMASLSLAMDDLDRIAKSSWKATDKHPDLDPAHKALLVRELYTELIRTSTNDNQPPDFRNWLTSSEAAARELETTLKQKGLALNDASQMQRLAKLKRQISSNCKACHAKYRDLPPIIKSQAPAAASNLGISRGKKHRTTSKFGRH